MHETCHSQSQTTSRSMFSVNNTVTPTITSLPKVIWKEGRVAALSHTYAVKSPLVTMTRPKFAPKSTSSRGPILKPHYPPHPWTRPTYDAKRHPIRFAVFPQCTGQTDRQTERPTDRSSKGKFDDYRPLRYDMRRGLKLLIRN